MLNAGGRAKMLARGQPASIGQISCEKELSVEISREKLLRETRRFSF